MKTSAKSGARFVWPRDPAGILPGVAMFAGALGLAWFYDWKTTDLLWSTWFTGVVVGYAALLIGVVGEWRRKRGLPFVGVVAIASGLFFTVHFLGFNWLMAFWLNLTAPLEGLRGGFWSAHFWAVLATHYWPILLMAVVTERQMLGGAIRQFDKTSPYLPVIRTWAIFLPLFMLSLAGEMTKLFTIDHIVCYVLAALAYFSPWRLEFAPESEAERS